MAFRLAKTGSSRELRNSARALPFIPPFSAPSRPETRRGDQNFDAGMSAVGGLAEIAGDADLFAWVAAQPGDMVFAWRAIMSGTLPMRDGIVTLAEVTLLVVTLLMAAVTPQMMTSDDELGFEGSAERVLVYRRATLFLNTIVISCSVAAFVIAWDLVYQAYEVPSSKAFIIWVLQSQNVYLTMVSLAVTALITELAVTFVTAAAQYPPEQHYEVLGAGVFSAVFVLCFWAYVARKHWRSAPFMATAFSGDGLKEHALQLLRQIHEEHKLRQSDAADEAAKDSPLAM